MERIKCLGRYQKVILLFMIIIVLGFALLYSITISREGFAYKNVILIPNLENGNTIYSGEIQGKQAIFTVSADKTVAFEYDGKLYGPYTAKEDATAVPKDSPGKEGMTGIELYCGEEVIFRGGIAKANGFWLRVNEDGSPSYMITITSTSNGITKNQDGNIIDPMKPSVSTILDLMAGPELTHKGTWGVWLFGVLICFVNTISILFADELFRLGLSFRVNNVDDIEPSDWEIGSRYIAWTVLPVLALILCIMGLQ